MKFVGKILLSLLVILLALVIVLYLLLQTRWGASWLSRTVSQHSSYQLAVGKLEHNFSAPSHLILHDVSFGHKTRPATLVAKSVDLRLSAGQFSRPLHFASVLLNQGTLRITSKTSQLPLSAARLQLSEMAVSSHHDMLPLDAQHVNGGVMPWQPEATSFIGNNASFQFSAGSLTFKDIPARNVLIEGRIRSKQLELSNMGADVARGSVTASAQRDEQGSWQVSTLRLNNLRLQSSKTLAEFLQPLLTLPVVHFERVDVTDARLEGQNWAVTDLNLALKNITLRDGDWESEDGSLSMNASSFVNGALLLNDPIVNMTFSPQGAALTQFSSRWVNGLIRASGNWTRSDKKLTLDDVVIAGLEYTLPPAWRAFWLSRLPAWLHAVEVTKLNVSHNLIIDIDPDFPFQLTSLDGNGSNLLLARDREWGIWGGNLSFNAAEATFNRVDLRHPSLALTADSNAINVTEMSAFPRSGLLEGLATVSQQPQRAFSLSLHGRETPLNLLQDWGWPAVPLTENGELTLKMQGSLAKDAPLKPSVNGSLSAVAGDKSVQQTVQAGNLGSR
jgi:hypothetical protein